MKRTNPRHGFTLIELLVVIAIIGLLASIVLISLDEPKRQAEAAVMLKNLRSMEQAFILLAAEKGIDQWWTFDYNPTIQELIDDPNFGLDTYLSLAPTPPAGGGEAFRYDSDRDDDGDGTYDDEGDPEVLNACEADVSGRGVNIMISGASREHFDIINPIVDGEDEVNPNYCGQIKWSGGNFIFYQMSEHFLIF